jgi:hypothetical protein
MGPLVGQVTAQVCQGWPLSLVMSAHTVPSRAMPMVKLS